MFRTAAPPISTSNLDSPNLFSHVSSFNPASTSTSTAPTVDYHSSNAPRDYPFRLNFYDKPPLKEITIEQFEGWAIDRLKVLSEIESSKARNRTPNELKQLVQAQCKAHLPLSATTAARNANVDLGKERWKDHVSHFVLRLAFCRSDDLRHRFIKAETELFKIRLETDDLSEREAFLKSLNFQWELVSSGEKELFKNELMTSSFIRRDGWDAEAFMKVKWQRVPELISQRKVFVKGGMAWVPMKEQSSLVVAEFQNRLTRELEMTSKAIPRLDEDDRLLPLLSHLSMGFLAGISNDYSDSSLIEHGQELTSSMVYDLVMKHAPLCMKNLNTTLKEKGHLKHFGRQQFGLFLKEIGLPLEEAIVFWRNSFRNHTQDQFNKEYKYNIRHNYGQEGGRINYPAKSCQRILTTDIPGPQDSHGCPFRHFSAQNLSSALTSQYKLNQNDIKEILKSVKDGHYHVGCTRVFELTHKKYGVKRGDGLGNGESVQHPNRYFERSWTLDRDSQHAGEGKIKNSQEGGMGMGMGMEMEMEMEMGNEIKLDDDAVQEPKVEMELDPLVTEPTKS